MDNQVLITIIILVLITILFTITYINSKKIPLKKKARIYEKLEDLKTQIKSIESYARRDAIIRLDNLLGKSFNLRYKNSNSCGDNLKIAKGLFDKRLYQRLWDVHKIRNEIVHRDRDVSSSEAEEVYHVYKLGIKRTLE